MTWFFAILVVLALAGVAVIASGRGGSMPEAHRDHPDLVLPEGDLRAEDLRRIRLTTSLRGYRMSEVDALLDRLATQLDQTGPSSHDS